MNLLGTIHTLRTLDSGISVASGINVAPGTFGEKNEHSPLKKHILVNQIREFRTFLWITLFNKDVLEKIPKINKRTPMFIPESRVSTCKGGVRN